MVGFLQENSGKPFVLAQGFKNLWRESRCTGVREKLHILDWLPPRVQRKVFVGEASSWFNRLKLSNPEYKVVRLTSFRKCCKFLNALAGIRNRGRLFLENISEKNPFEEIFSWFKEYSRCKSVIYGFVSSTFIREKIRFLLCFLIKPQSNVVVRKLFS